MTDNQLIFRSFASGSSGNCYYLGTQKWGVLIDAGISARTIQKSLRELPVKCTKLIIAQRISSVRHADKIMILENGKLTIGTHDSLAATNGYYRSICEFQDVKDLPPFVGNDPIPQTI